MNIFVLGVIFLNQNCIISIILIFINDVLK